MDYERGSAVIKTTRAAHKNQRRRQATEAAANEVSLDSIFILKEQRTAFFFFLHGNDLFSFYFRPASARV